MTIRIGTDDWRRYHGLKVPARPTDPHDTWWTVVYEMLDTHAPDLGQEVMGPKMTIDTALEHLADRRPDLIIPRPPWHHVKIKWVSDAQPVD